MRAFGGTPSTCDRIHNSEARRTFLSQWLERSGSLASLLQMRGHARIVTTQRCVRLTDEAVVRERSELAAFKASGPERTLGRRV